MVWSPPPTPTAMSDVRCVSANLYIFTCIFCTSLFPVLQHPRSFSQGKSLCRFDTTVQPPGRRPRATTPYRLSNLPLPNLLLPHSSQMDTNKSVPRTWLSSGDPMRCAALNRVETAQLQHESPASSAMRALPSMSPRKSGQQRRFPGWPTPSPSPLRPGDL